MSIDPESPHHVTAAAPQTRGFFLTMEGIEGAGKSTIAHMIEKELTATGTDVIVTAEPGGDRVAKRIRRLLLDSMNQIADRSELLLFEASRAQHVEMTILPALSRGATVICDRFADSSIAYQGFARGTDLDTVKWLNNYATGGLKPDLTILLDMPVEAGLRRQRKLDRMSAQSIQFHEAVREGYLSIARAEPDRFAVIDASLDAKEVLRQSLAAIEIASSRLTVDARIDQRGE